MDTDLLRMIRLFVATARRLNDRRVWNPDWVAALHRIEAEIAEHRENPTFPPQTSQRDA